MLRCKLIGYAFLKTVQQTSVGESPTIYDNMSAERASEQVWTQFNAMIQYASQKVNKYNIVRAS